MSESWAFPLVVFAVSLVAQWLAAYCGSLLRKAITPLKRDDYSDVDVVRTATLTLLALIIGFSFSMAVNRYDMRKTYEEAEANAIGTEYARADLMPEAAPATRRLLKQYLELRIQFYLTADPVRLEQIRSETDKLSAELWALARSNALAQPTAVAALAAAGMNDVLNSADYTAAAWLNRIPVPAWWLLILIGVGSNLTIGLGTKRFNSLLLTVLPLTIAVSLFLIADIDSPRGGVVQVKPQNLGRLAASLNAS